MLIDEEQNIVQMHPIVGKKTRTPIEAAEGVLIDSERYVSTSEIEVLDIVSEGEIEGLVTGSFAKSGNVGDLGFSSFSESLFPAAPLSGGSAFLLDNLINEAAYDIWSNSRAVNGFQGPIINVFKSGSTDEHTDIGTTGFRDILDVDSIQAFAGETKSTFVRRVYGQVDSSFLVPVDTTPNPEVGMAEINSKDGEIFKAFRNSVPVAEFGTRFNGNHSFVTPNGAPSIGSFTGAEIFIVVQPIQNDTHTGFYNMGETNQGSSLNGVAEFGTDETKHYAAPSWADIENGFIYNVTATDDEWTVRYDNKIIYSTPSNTFDFPATLRFGRDEDLGRFKGSFGEMWLFKRGLTNAERNLVTQNISEYYGMVATTLPEAEGSEGTVFSDIRWLSSVYWNNTPVVDSNNKFNFQAVSVSFTGGLPNGAVLSEGQQKLTVSRNIQERLRGAPEEGPENPENSDFAKIYRIVNKDCTGAFVNIRVDTLFETIRSGKKAGDINITSIKYSIYYKPIFSDINKLKDYELGASEEISGKITGGYIRETRIDFQKASEYINDRTFNGWEIKIIRQTPDSTSTALRNRTSVDSLTELYNDIFVYPNTSIVRQKFNAEYFNQIPQRTFRIRGIKCKVPTNYEPRSKTYGLDTDPPAGLTDYWAGEFKTKKEWTSNPAWCFYDLATNRRYGLGKYIDPAFIDKFTLYEIAKYCDVLVADGKGGVEPRFSANLTITSRSEAYKVLNDMVSIFRGITYYSSGGILTTADQPKEPLWIFNNANVGSEGFQYSSSSKRVRSTVAVVRYNDADNFFAPSVEFVEDIDSIKRYGIREKDLSAFGCTSRGQALRLGRWALLTEALETESVVFTAGIEATYLKPGDIFRVNDDAKAPKRFGGRLVDSEVTSFGASLTLDSQIDIGDDAIYNMSLLTPSFNLDTSLDEITGSNQFSDIRKSMIQTLAFTGSNSYDFTGVDNQVRTKIDFSPNTFDFENYIISGELIWSIEFSEGNVGSDIISGQYQDFRTINVTEEDGHTYNVSAIKYDETKYSLIESGLIFEEQNEPSEGVPFPPSTSQLVVSQVTENTKIINYHFTVNDESNVDGFRIYMKKGSELTDSDISDNTYLIDFLPSSSRNGSVIPSSSDTYYFRFYSANARGTLSETYELNNIFVGDINPIMDLQITSLRLEDEESKNPAGTTLTVETDDVDLNFEWIPSSEVSSLTELETFYRVTIREQSLTNTPSEIIYADYYSYSPVSDIIPNFVFTIENNIGLENGPFRNYDIVVESHNSEGDSSAGGNFFTDANSLGYGDSSFSNSLGYDILAVQNPKITGVYLTDRNQGETCEDSLMSGNTCTDQYITPGGDIVISVISGLNNIEDFAGIVVFYDTGTFSQEEASGGDISSVSVPAAEGVQKTFIAPVGWADVETGYISVGAYDFFDEETNISEDGAITGLELSNVVQIRARGQYDDSELRQEILEGSEGIDFLGNQVSGMFGVDSDILLTSGSPKHVMVDTTSAIIRVNLFELSEEASGKAFIIKDYKGTSSTNPILIDPYGETQLIDGLTGLEINSDFGSYEIIEDGNNWSIISNYV